MKLSLVLSLLLAWTAFSAPTIVIHGGEHDSENSVVTFQAPDKLRGNHMMQAASGESTPLQIGDDGRAVFIEPKLGKGETRTYTLAPLPPSAVALGMKATREEGVLEVFTQADKKPVFTYQMVPGEVPPGTSEQFKHGAHLHPVFSPSGRLLTGNHPVDHPHQRGIFFAWTHTEFGGTTPDFWNMGKDKTGKLTGEVRFEKLEKSFGGPVQGGFRSVHGWYDHSSGSVRSVLTETWDVAVCRTTSNDRPVYLLDLTSTQECATSEPLILPKYHYGGLGVRGCALWDPVDKVSMLTSNGDDRIKGDGTKAKWLWLGGEVEGQTTGIAVLIHPSNLRFPQPLRLNPKNPQICVAPSADGDWSIEPGKPYISRYRIVLADGKPDAAELEDLWEDYTQPPKIEVRMK